jgi:hypothetical protein
MLGLVPAIQDKKETATSDEVEKHKPNTGFFTQQKERGSPPSRAI